MRSFGCGKAKGPRQHCRQGKHEEMPVSEYYADSQDAMQISADKNTPKGNPETDSIRRSFIVAQKKWELRYITAALSKSA